MFRICIIDSGIDSRHPRLKDCKISGIEIHKNSDLQIEIREDSFSDELGHGTAIASIIHRIVPEIELFAIKISAFDNKITEDILIEAFKFCLKINRIRIINVSMGVETKQPNALLYDVVKEIVAKEIFICASSHNIPSIETYPANFPEVISVTSGIIRNKMEYGYYRTNKFHFIAKGMTQRVAWNNGSYRITSGTSFATANITGILALKISSNQRLKNKEILDLMVECASANIRVLQYVRDDRNYVISDNIKESVDLKGERVFRAIEHTHNIEKIALFPVCEKEIRTIINFQGQCPFKITRYYDYPRNLSFFQIKDSLKIEITRDINERDFGEFDTLICGYFLDQKFDANILFGYELTEAAIRNNKNIITWDAEVYKYISKYILENKHEYRGKIIIPHVNRHLYNKIMNFRYLPRVNIPVLLVLGSSNKQGKITTQLRIKEIMQSAGYKISLVSTEPQGLVLGADFTFPYGYKSTVDISDDLWGSFINTVCRGVQKYNKPHMIISGTQGKFIPRGKSVEELTSEGILSSLYYTCGIMPDAVIIAINPQDTLEQINNLIQAVKIFSSAKILCFVMTPVERNYSMNSEKVIGTHRYLELSEYEARLNYFQTQINIPGIDIMNKKNDSYLLNLVEDAFSGNTKSC